MSKIKIIAELGSVHDGSFGNCLKLIDLAKKSGADMVKLQHHLPDEETLRNAPKPSFFKSENRYEYFKRIGFNTNQWKKIIKYCKKKKIDFMCSVFSEKSFEFLKKLGVKNIKIPSGEITNLPLLYSISKSKGLNILISTGMSNWKEINKSVKILSRNNKICIFQCTSMYPCPAKYSGINIVKEFCNKFKPRHSIGFSDHTIGSVAAILAFSQGATFFEKHLTFSKDMYGSDAKYASNPDEFKEYCESLKTAEIIMNSNLNKDNIAIFKNMRKVFQKSIYYNYNLPKGHKIKLEDLAYKKPDNGISASNFKYVIGKILKSSVKKNSLVRTKDF